jgi:hypothetical protein
VRFPGPSVPAPFAGRPSGPNSSAPRPVWRSCGAGGVKTKRMPGVVLRRDHLHCPSTARAQLLPLSLLPGLLCLLYQSLLVVSCLQRTRQLKKRAHGRYGGAANAAPTAFFPPRPLLRPGLDDAEPSKNITARGGPCPTCAQPCPRGPSKEGAMLFATRLLFDDVGRIACRRQAGSVSHRSMLARLAKVFVPQGVVPGACFVLRRHCPLGLLRCWASPLASCLLQPYCWCHASHACLEC